MSDIVEQFDKLGRDASFHFADDSGKEWHLGYSKQKKAMNLWHAHPELHEEMRKKAQEFLWSLDLALKGKR